MPCFGEGGGKIVGLGFEAASFGEGGGKIAGLGLGFKLFTKSDAFFVSLTFSMGPFPVLRVWLVPLSWHPKMVTAIANRMNSDGEGKVESSFINESDS